MNYDIPEEEHKTQKQLFFKTHKKTTTLESLLNKVLDLRTCSFIKKRLQHGCFPVNFAKFLREPFLQNIC